MHSKQDSEGGTSMDTSWPPRSPPRRPIYYVQSPTNHDYVEKMSYGSSPMGSPVATHHFYHYHCSPIHHSRESSTTRFSASLKNPGSLSAWKHMPLRGHGGGRGGADDDDDDEDDEMDGGDGRVRGARNFRVYLCAFFIFVALFTVFSLILWGASKSYRPEISVKNIVFENFNVQAGADQSGVPTDMLSINSTVKISYRNPGTFFAVHVTSSPWELYYYQLRVASGQMRKFTQSRKTHQEVTTVVHGQQVPLYGGVSVISDDAKQRLEKVAVPLNLTFVMRSRAYILGRLVKSKFYSHIRCSVTLRGNKLGKPLNLIHSCTYR